MEDFANILERNYGLKPQGKMAPMSNVRQPSFSSSITEPAPAENPRNGTNHRSSAPILADDDPFSGGGRGRSSSSGRHNTFSGSDPLVSRYDDVFGGPPSASSSTNIFEDIFRPAATKHASVPSAKGPSSYPVFDAPVYDDDIFGGLPGIRSVDSTFEDVFNVDSAAAAAPTESPTSFDDLLGGFGSSDAKDTTTKTKSSSGTMSAGESAFDELLPGFGGAEPAKTQLFEDGKPSQRNNPKPVNGFSANILEDTFSVFNSVNVPRTNPSTSASNLGFTEATGDSDKSSKNMERNHNSTSSANFENDPSRDSPELSKASPVAAESYLPKKSRSGPSESPNGVSEGEDSNDVSTYSKGIRSDNVVRKERKKPMSGRAKLDSSMPTSSAESASVGSPSHRNRAAESEEGDDVFQRSRPAFRESAVSPTPSQIPKVGRSGGVDEFWLSIDDMKLVTQPTIGPPPIRPPPVPGARQAYAQRKPSPEVRWTENGNHPHATGGIDAADPVLNDLEAFALGSSRRMDADAKDYGASSPGEEEQGSAAATASGAAMREAIERAEAKLRQAKEAKDRDREEAPGMRNNEGAQTCDRDDGGETEAMHDREEREREEGEREAREKWRKEREREKREREKRREKEKEEREKDRANEIARQRAAVERANAEVRERESLRAVERVAEARMKAERAAVEKATAEVRERHAEKARAEKAVATEREKAAAMEREKAARDRMAAPKDQQHKNEDDLESFFRSTTSRPTSAPKQRTNPTDGTPTAQPLNEGLWRSSNSASHVKKVPSMPSMADDLTSLFGGPPSGPGTFQEIEGEPADRRKARWDRHQRTLERAARALEEKHQRDLQSAKDQEERHRAGELVDAEIKRWAAGKEGNLRALLSTLHYVLWPECGWQAVSLTDLITAAAVKKVYRKATLYVHPDKVQQKGATNQQKYIAGKVFDLLKEAWNKFNSEELF